MIADFIIIIIFWMVKIAEFPSVALSNNPSSTCGF